MNNFVIIKCSNKSYWYNDPKLIYESFNIKEIVKIGGEEWLIIDNKKNSIEALLKSDCISSEDYESIEKYVNDEERKLDIVTQKLFEKEKEDIGEIELESKLFEMSEEDFEIYINKFKNSASLEYKKKIIKIRKNNRKLINTLKDRYSSRCQVCDVGWEKYNVSIAEAHHIEKFSITQNDEPNNILIVCPNHHRLIHNAKGEIDIKEGIIIYNNGHIEKIAKIGHLKIEKGKKLYET